MKAGKRHVVTYEGIVFPGHEGPDIEIKNQKSEKIHELTVLLGMIQQINNSFYSEISAIDINYRNEVIIYRKDYYLKLPEIDEIDETAFKRYIYLLDICILIIINI